MTLRWIAVALIALTLASGCGRKGDPVAPGEEESASAISVRMVG